MLRNFTMTPRETRPIQVSVDRGLRYVPEATVSGTVTCRLHFAYPRDEHDKALEIIPWALPIDAEGTVDFREYSTQATDADIELT